VAARTPAASAGLTPVDLQSYTSWKQESGERVAAAGGSRVPFSRRAVLDLPRTVPPPEALDPNESNESSDSMIPGAEFEPVSPLDVPAFLRRQSEA
jgi:hypothetical protein